LIADFVVFAIDGSGQRGVVADDEGVALGGVFVPGGVAGFA
jgi:hypothetical protein